MICYSDYKNIFEVDFAKQLPSIPLLDDTADACTINDITENVHLELMCDKLFLIQFDKAPIGFCNGMSASKELLKLIEQSINRTCIM